MGLRGPALTSPTEALPFELRTSGTGAPVTLAAHGLGASLDETRPLLSGVPGTRVLYAARGHGGTPLPDGPVDYAALGRDLRAVADACSATQALGVSMGASALLNVLAATPDRFARVVLFLPAAIDRPRTDLAVRRLEALAAALDAADLPAVEAEVAREIPDDLRSLPAAQAYVATRARHLLGCPGVARAVRELPDATPVPDRSALAAVAADVLVLAQEGDDLHPAQVARELVGVLPKARLVVFDQPGVVFRERARLRGLISGFLSAHDEG